LMTARSPVVDSGRYGESGASEVICTLALLSGYDRPVALRRRPGVGVCPIL
jgi:hypothetical protein